MFIYFHAQPLDSRKLEQLRCEIAVRGTVYVTLRKPYGVRNDMTE